MPQPRADHWAIVIGLNNYESPGANLTAPLTDAVEFCRWLIEYARVDRERILLGLAPLSGIQGLPEADKQLLEVSKLGWAADIRRKDDLVALLHQCVLMSRGCGDRLYFFFSGHGMRYEIRRNRFEDAIVGPDCTAMFTDRSLAIPSILEFFEETAFRDQFFFFDACRNLPWTHPFQAGVVPTGPQISAPRVTNQVFVARATSPGAPAVQVANRSIFSSALQEALMGQIRAKRLDASGNRFVLRWDDCFEFVHSETQRTPVILQDGSPFFQVPRKDGMNHGGLGLDPNPVLWEEPFGARPFADVAVSVDITPAAAAAKCTLEVRPILGDRQARFSPPPDPITLPPGRYEFDPRSEGYVLSRRAINQVDIESDCAVFLPMEPVGSAGPSPAAAVPTSTVPSGTVPTGTAPRVMAPVPPQLPSTGSVRPIIGDDLLGWRILNLSGSVVSEALGDRSGPIVLPSGRYRLTSLDADASAEGVRFDVTSGGHVDVRLSMPLPSPAIQSLGQRMQMGAQTDALAASEALGMVRGMRLSTLLALASCASSGDGSPTPFGNKLRALGLEPAMHLARHGHGIRVVVGSERVEAAVRPGARLGGIRLSLRTRDRSSPSSQLRPVFQDEVCAIGECWLPSGEGCAQLRISQAADDDVPEHSTMHLFVPRDQVLTVVIHETQAGEIVLEQYSTRPGPPTVESLRQTRLLDTVQRSVLRGSYDFVGGVDAFLRFDEQNLIASLVGAYLLARANELDRAEQLALRLAGRYPEAPDPHVVLGDCALRRGAAADGHFMRAFERGLPTFSGGLARLNSYFARSDRMPDTARLAELLARRVPGTLWTTLEG